MVGFLLIVVGDSRMSVRYFVMMPDETIHNVVDAYDRWEDGELRESDCSKDDSHCWEDGCKTVAITKKQFNKLIEDSYEKED
jgi:hypothetical protein